MVSDDGNILNFSRFRKIARDEQKRRERLESEAQAAANRVRFGRTGAEKRQSRLDREREAARHEGTRRAPPRRDPNDKSFPTSPEDAGPKED